MKTIDHLFHISKELDRIRIILQEGFKPSYAREQFSEFNILVPMVSFSNILLRDVGEGEVLNYGTYGLCFTREWGIRNGLDPVAYTYNDGKLEKAIRDYFFSSLFLSNLEAYKPKLKEWSKAHRKCPGKMGPLSKHLDLTNTPAEVMAILDHLSVDYAEEKADIFIAYAAAIRKATLPIIRLAKPYKVANAEGREFIAYNDREWRKIYDDLDFYVKDSDEYTKWDGTPKPHFHAEKYRLTFDISDVKAILVQSTDDVDGMIQFLQNHRGKQKTDLLLRSGSLKIGTRDELIKDGF